MFKRGKGNGHHRGWGGHLGRELGLEEDGPGRSGRARAFEYGKLRYVVLQMLADKPSHGYEIIKEIERKSGGAYVPSPGVVYPTLAMLEDQGLIAAGAEDDNRKLYKMTPAGKKFLAENKAVVDELSARLAAGAARGSSEALPIMRAMQNLKTALRLRVGEGSLNVTQVQAIAAVLDAAAGEIERV